MNKIKGHLIIATILSDYVMWCLADEMLIGLNSDKSDVYEWSLEGLKKLGELRQKQKESGYLGEHYKEISQFLGTITITEVKSE